MNIRTINSTDALNDVLQDSDALVNFTSEAIASLAPAVSLSRDGTAKLINGPAYPVDADVDAKAISSLVTNEQRLVVITDSIDKSEQFVAQLSEFDITCVVCVLDQLCAADAFMDEKDSEAVAERLRQLGYI
jgi:hypothetical protein